MGGSEARGQCQHPLALQRERLPGSVGDACITEASDPADARRAVPQVCRDARHAGQTHLVKRDSLREGVCDERDSHSSALLVHLGDVGELLPPGHAGAGTPQRAQQGVFMLPAPGVHATPLDLQHNVRGVSQWP